MNKIGGICFAHQQVGTVHKIYLYDEVKAKGDFNWKTLEYDESETSANHFRELLEGVSDSDTIELYINSDGGSVKEGTAIFTNLKRCKAYKTGYVDGVANSIAATILQACDHRVMGEGTGIGPSQYVDGSHRQCGRTQEPGRQVGCLDESIQISFHESMRREDHRRGVKRHHG